jgi:hypothetical protein
MPIELGKKYTTRDGRPARVLCVDRKGDICPVVALVASKVDDSDLVVQYTSDGHANKSVDKSGLDLIPVPEKRTVWLNIYPGEARPCAHWSQDKANAFGSPERIACIPAEIEIPAPEAP